MDDQQTRITYLRNKLEKRVDSKTMVIIDSLIKTCLDEPINYIVQINRLCNWDYHLVIFFDGRIKCKEYWYLSEGDVLVLVNKIKKTYNVERINNNTDIKLD